MPARFHQIRDSPEGSDSDALPLNQDRVGTVIAATGKIDIIVERVDLHPLVQLRSDTTGAQIRRVVDGIREVLADHPAVERDTVRVRFLGFGATSMDIEVYAYVLARDWNDFLEIQERLLLRTMDIVARAGARIAIPSQITYHANVPGVGVAGEPGLTESL